MDRLRIVRARSSPAINVPIPLGIDVSADDIHEEVNSQERVRDEESYVVDQREDTFRFPAHNVSRIQENLTALADHNNVSVHWNGKTTKTRDDEAQVGNDVMEYHLHAERSEI